MRVLNFSLLGPSPFLYLLPSLQVPVLPFPALILYIQPALWVLLLLVFWEWKASKIYNA